jgi:hypothetical protein
MSALHPRPPAKTPKKKSVFPPFPEPNMATLPAPAVIDPLPDETKANKQFSSSALPKRYAVKRRFSEQKNARFTAALIRISPCLSFDER